MALHSVLKTLLGVIVISVSVSAAGQIDLGSRKLRPRSECEEKVQAFGIEEYSKKSALLKQLKSEIASEKDEEKLRVLKEKEQKEIARIRQKAKDDAIEVCVENPA